MYQKSTLHGTGALSSNGNGCLTHFIGDVAVTTWLPSGVRKVPTCRGPAGSTTVFDADRAVEYSGQADDRALYPEAFGDFLDS